MKLSELPRAEKLLEPYATKMERLHVKMPPGKRDFWALRVTWKGDFFNTLTSMQEVKRHVMSRKMESELP